jgi:glutamyl-tRNA reductase
MLMGAGEMAELAAKHLLNYGASRLLIVNRTFENAAALAGELNGEPVPFEEFEERLPEAEILIFSTGAPNYLIRPDHVRRALERRRSRPMPLVDISAPRNIDPAIGKLENAFLFDVETWSRLPRPTAPSASARRCAPRRSSKPRPNNSSARWPKATSAQSSARSANKSAKWLMPNSSAAANASAT